jgi:hypothetical protein
MLEYNVNIRRPMWTSNGENELYCAVGNECEYDIV